MIICHINSKREAVMSLMVCGAADETHEIQAIIDTGYSGFLTLPTAMITALGLSSIGTEQLTLADGSEVVSAVCPATIVWDGQLRAIEVDTLESDALVGMALMDGYDLNMHITVGGQVTLTSFAPTVPPATS